MTKKKTDKLNPDKVSSGPLAQSSAIFDFRGKVLFEEEQGGLGREICMTGVAKAIKDQYPDCELWTRTSYPDVFQHLPFVETFLPLEPRAYMRREIKDHEIVRAQPYKDLRWRRGQEHLIDTWCRLIGVKAPKEKRGIIILSEAEKRDAKRMLQHVARPLIALQWLGGTSNQRPGDANGIGRLQQCRHLSQETAQKIVDLLREEKAAVLQVSLPTEPRLKDVLFLDENNVTPTREMFALLNECDGLIAIDSFAGHAWAAMGKKNAVRLWGYSNPTNYGYATDNNLTAPQKNCQERHCNRPESHLGDVVGNLRPWSCPYGGECMNFDPKVVAAAAMRSVKEKKEERSPEPVV